MKSKKTDSKTKAKVKIKSLKLHKETIENLSDQDAGAVQGGGSGSRGGGAEQGGSSGGLAQCWVARAVYGEDNPRWALFRDWLMADAPDWFRALYLRHGERFALWLTPHTCLKAVIRCWMDSRIERRSCALTQPA